MLLLLMLLNWFVGDELGQHEKKYKGKKQSNLIFYHENYV